MIADLPIAAKFGVTEFNCAATELSHEETLVLCGDIPRRAVRIVHAATAFTVDATYKPQARLSLKFPDPSAFTNYEIVSIAKAPDMLSYETVLKADNRA
jgi:hypothetical protein